MGREADRGPSGLSEPVFEQPGGVAGHLDRADPTLGVGDEFGPGGMRRHARRTGVWDAHRDGHEGHGQPNREPVGDLPDGDREPLPLQVRLRTGEQQERGTGLVAHPVQDQCRLGVVGEGVGDEGQGRPTRPVVDQPVDVELCHWLVREGAEQFANGELDARSRRRRIRPARSPALVARPPARRRPPRRFDRALPRPPDSPARTFPRHRPSPSSDSLPDQGQRSRALAHSATTGNIALPPLQNRATTGNIELPPGGNHPAGTTPGEAHRHRRARSLR